MSVRPPTAYLMAILFLLGAAMPAAGRAQSTALAADVGEADPAEVPGLAPLPWHPGSYAGGERPFRAGAFVGEFRADTALHYSLAQPRDHTLGGSSEVFRHGELQVTQLGFGGDINYQGAHARLMTQFGLYATTTPRNDASPTRGQWQLADAYRYLSEAYAGYTLPVLEGINIQAGLFMSYIGLWSYYNFDNWTQQPSYVSSNTPWFFQGIRAQILLTKNLKVEPWLINGWQSYGSFNDAPGVGGQVVWRPAAPVSLTTNNYYGRDTPQNPGRARYHSDTSVVVKYLERPGSFMHRAAASVTLDAGCEWGGGVTCKQQNFLGFMAYNRLWLAQEHFAATLGGGAITNPGRYLMLLPPINGATATSGSPYFSASPGDTYRAWDAQIALDYLPVPYALLRVEYTHRAANLPYFAGRNGMTPPGGNQGSAGSTVPGWQPDLRRNENRFTLALSVKI